MSSPPRSEAARRQDVVADLGRRALETDDIDRLIHDVSVAVDDALDTDYCGAFELSPDGDEASLRRGVGFRDGVVGDATVSAAPDSLVGRALRSAEPVVVANLRTETTPSESEPVTGHDAVSGIGAVVGRTDDPWGALVAQVTERREFTEHDASFVQSTANVLASAIESERSSREREDEAETPTELQQYETIVETINDGVYVVDSDYRFSMVNETYAEMTGYSRDELLGSHVSLVVDDETMQKAKEWESARTDGRTESRTVEARLRTESGDAVPAEATFALLPDDGGERKRVGVVRDVTERKARERTLAESERRYRTLVEHFPNGAVGLFDEDLRYTAVGGEILENVGVSSDEIVGQTVWDRYPEELAEQLEPNFRAALEGETNSFEMEFHDRTWMAYTLPVEDDEGDVFAGTMMVQDITDRREYQRKLEQSNERLEQFAYAVSHDLQEPLRMVSSYLQLIERRYEDDLDAEGREFIEYAVDGAERMRDMIDGLLEYSRVETEGDPLEPVDLDDVFDDVRRDLRMRIEESDAEIEAASLPRVRGDEGQLHQVFQNLLSNAIEYAGDEPPEIHVSAERTDHEWVISVRDEGIGIDPDDHDRIFEVFQRLHSRDEHPGTGIGLALCQRIVERHGGRIWVESEPGDWTTFSFTLPAAGETDG